MQPGLILGRNFGERNGVDRRGVGGVEGIRQRPFETRQIDGVFCAGAMSPSLA